jgi:hypothetical protein
VVGHGDLHRDGEVARWVREKREKELRVIFCVSQAADFSESVAVMLSGGMVGK